VTLPLPSSAVLPTPGLSLDAEREANHPTTQVVDYQKLIWADAYEKLGHSIQDMYMTYTGKQANAQSDA